MKRQLVDQQAVAEALADVMELDHLVAEALGDGDEEFVGFVALLVIGFRHFVEAGQARLALGLAGLGVAAHPFEFLLHGLHVGVFLLGFGLQPRFLLFQPVGIIALPRDAVAAVEFENPLGGVVEEVAVVGDGDHGAGEAGEELLQPLHRFGVEVVGRLVEQQHVGAREQQLAQRDAALFAAGEMS